MAHLASVLTYPLCEHYVPNTSRSLHEFDTVSTSSVRYFLQIDLLSLTHHTYPPHPLPSTPSASPSHPPTLAPASLTPPHPMARSTSTKPLLSPPPYTPITPLYPLFLLYIEPFFAGVGALCALLYPALYLSMTHHGTSISDRARDVAALCTTNQLGNLYLYFALAEALVLRAASYTSSDAPDTHKPSKTPPSPSKSRETTSPPPTLRKTRYINLHIWRTLLLTLLIADFGHLWAVRNTASSYWEVYAAFWTWNGMGWGNVGFVYFGALTRVAFLMGIGVAGEGGE